MEKMKEEDAFAFNGNDMREYNMQATLQNIREQLVSIDIEPCTIATNLHSRNNEPKLTT
jgi:hypothetical protein